MMRKTMRCKGKKNGEPCGNDLCQTDGKSIFIALESGRELELVPKKALGLVCEKCGYENTWYRQKE